MRQIAKRIDIHRDLCRHRVLIADDDTPFARRLSDYLWDHGYEARVTSRISEAKDIVEYWSPDTVFIDLFLPETNALALFKFINSKTLKKRPRVVVMSRQSMPQGIEQMRRAGAAEYLVKPFSLEDAFVAVAVAPAEKPAAKAAAAELAPSTLRELQLINLFLKQATQGRDSSLKLYNLMRMMNLKVNAIRTSLIQCLDEKSGIVLASNDDENIQGLRLNLAQYPEIREVIRTERTVIIPNVRTSDILAPVAPRLENAPFETLVLFPIHREGQFFGVISVRMERKDPLEVFYAEKFGQVCAQIIPMAIGTPGQPLANL